MDRKYFVMTALSAIWIAVRAAEAPLFGHIIGVQQPHALEPEQINPELHGDTPTQLWAARHIVTELGSDMIKIAIEKRHLEKQGFKIEGNPSLTELAGHDLYRKILALPYRTVFFWAHGQTAFQYYTPAKAALVYQEFYEFTEYLLTAFNNSGKTFMIGNWEGDWILGAPAAGKGGDCSEESIQRMISWMNVRGKAVEDARKAVAHKNVQVYFYMELNLVREARVKGLKRMVNSVLPHAKYTDYVSVSSYDIQGMGAWDKPQSAASLRAKLFQDLDYVQSMLPPRPLTGRRVGIGEIGFALVHIKHHYRVDEKQAEIIQARLALESAMVNLEWGVPFWQWWALHNNEVCPDGGFMGFGLIDQRSAGKRRLWYELKAYNEWARDFIEAERSETGRAPSSDSLRQAAILWLKGRVAACQTPVGRGP